MGEGDEQRRDGGIVARARGGRAGEVEPERRPLGGAPAAERGRAGVGEERGGRDEELGAGEVGELRLAAVERGAQLGEVLGRDLAEVARAAARARGPEREPLARAGGGGGGRDAQQREQAPRGGVEAEVAAVERGAEGLRKREHEALGGEGRSPVARSKMQRWSAVLMRAQGLAAGRSCSPGAASRRRGSGDVGARAGAPRVAGYPRA